MFILQEQVVRSSILEVLSYYNKYLILFNEQYYNSIKQLLQSNWYFQYVIYIIYVIFT